MPDNKSHHYVPQFYLRRFAHDSAKKRVRLFLINTRKHIPNAGIKGQCARPYLYGKNGKRERALAELEGAAATIINMMTSDLKVPEPDTIESAILLTFVLFQSERTIAAATRQERFVTHLARELVLSHPGITDDQKLAASDVKVKLGNAIDITMHAAASAIPVISDLRVKLLLNRTRMDFVTSDAPVAKHNQWCEKIRNFGTAGYACRGLQMFLPLSPRHLLLLFDPDVYRVDPSLNDVIDVNDEADVLALNSLQMLVAEECIYYQKQLSTAHVDALPIDKREEHGGIHSDQFTATDGTSTLIQVSHLPLPFRLRTSVIRVRPEMASIPLGERVQAYRPDALAVVRMQDAARGGPPSRPPISRGSRTFVRRAKR